MMKTELESLGAETLLQPTEKVRKTRHYLFTGVPDDVITIPACGDLGNSVVATRRLRNVTCPGCLDKLCALANAADYRDALAIVSQGLEFPEQPIEAVMEERFNNQPTQRARAHIETHKMLKSRHLDKVLDIPKNIIGTWKTTFYRNLIESGLIHGPQDREKVGLAVEEKVAELRERASSIREAAANQS